MYYKFLYTVVVFLVNGKNKWMNEWMNEWMNVYDLLFSLWLVAPAPFTLRKEKEMTYVSMRIPFLPLSCFNSSDWPWKLSCCGADAIWSAVNDCASCATCAVFDSKAFRALDSTATKHATKQPTTTKVLISEKKVRVVFSKLLIISSKRTNPSF